MPAEGFIAFFHVRHFCLLVKLLMVYKCHGNQIIPIHNIKSQIFVKCVILFIDMQKSREGKYLKSCFRLGNIFKVYVISKIVARLPSGRSIRYWSGRCSYKSSHARLVTKFFQGISDLSMTL